jgi:Immunity protein 22
MIVIGSVVMQDETVSHFWVGNFLADRAEAYFAEIWDETDEDRNHTPLSEFARDQDVKWYDHDCIEYGQDDQAQSIQDLVDGYSYSDQWADEVERRIIAAGLQDINFLVLIGEEQIAQPRSIQGDSYWLHYLGTIRYRI